MRLELQVVLARSPRAAAVLDLLEAASGLGLAVFLWMHMGLVASIYFGRETFDSIPRFLDDTGLSIVGIPPLVALFFLHALLAGRKLPGRYREHRVLWGHAARLGHRDTAAWIVQAVTGMGILVLAAVHFWVVLTAWPIAAAASVARIAATPFLVFYLVLLVLGELHAGIGLYRLAVKWGWPPRRPAAVVLELIGVALLMLGFGALYVFRSLG
jgi:fumarate reductase subunit C